MRSRRPGAAERGRWLLVVLLAIVLMGAADSCGMAMVAVQACNGDQRDSVVVFVEVNFNHQQQTLPPGVCVTAGAVSDDTVQSYSYRVAPGDPAKYRAGMSAFRDQTEAVIVFADENDPSDGANQLLEMSARIDAIREASVGQACSGSLKVGERLIVTIVRDAAGVWTCGPMELITPPPATASP